MFNGKFRKVGNIGLDVDFVAVQWLVHVPSAQMKSVGLRSFHHFAQGQEAVHVPPRFRVQVEVPIRVDVLVLQGFGDPRLTHVV